MNHFTILCHFSLADTSSLGALRSYWSSSWFLPSQGIRRSVNCTHKRCKSNRACAISLVQAPLPLKCIIDVISRLHTVFNCDNVAKQCLWSKWHTHGCAFCQCTNVCMIIPLQANASLVFQVHFGDGACAVITHEWIGVALSQRANKKAHLSCSRWSAKGALESHRDLTLLTTTSQSTWNKPKDALYKQWPGVHWHGASEKTNDSQPDTAHTATSKLRIKSSLTAQWVSVVTSRLTWPNQPSLQWKSGGQAVHSFVIRALPLSILHSMVSDIM